MTMRGNIASKFVSTVRAKDEFELEKDRIDISIGEEKVFFEKIVIVLQAEFRKLSGIPRQVRRDPSP